MNAGGALLAYVREDLDDVLACGRGERKQSNRVRALVAALTKGEVPSTWRRYTVPASVTAVEWMKDFAERVRQLRRFSESANLRDEAVWLGGLFAPEAYVTATRQLIAQSNAWSLEQLNMHVCVGDGAAPAERFTATGRRATRRLAASARSLVSNLSLSLAGLNIIGAECRAGNSISLTDAVQTSADRVALLVEARAERRAERLAARVPLRRPPQPTLHL